MRWASDSPNYPGAVGARLSAVELDLQKLPLEVGLGRARSLCEGRKPGLSSAEMTPASGPIPAVGGARGRAVARPCRPAWEISRAIRRGPAQPPRPGRR